MAGEWIAMNCDLWTSPEVIALSAFCQQHVSAARSRASARCVAIGALFRFWSIVDVHCDDGILLGYTADELDLEIGIDGFSQALIGVGWLVPCAQGVEIPGFEKWFSRSARRRRMNATYQRESRKRRQQLVSTPADKKLTTGQDRREQEIHGPRGVDQKCAGRKPKRTSVKYVDVAPMAQSIFEACRYSGNDGGNLWGVAALYEAGIGSLSEAEIFSAARGAELNGKDKPAHFFTCLSESVAKRGESLKELLRRVSIDGMRKWPTKRPYEDISNA